MRRASKGQIGTALFKVQQRVTGINPEKAVSIAKLARITNSKQELIEDPVDESELEESDPESEDEEVFQFIKNESVKLESSKAKAEFFSGIRFQMRLDTFELRLMIPRREITF